MAKFCANGHQMEDSWDICPYCQRTGYQGLGKTAAGGAKTRLESDPAPGNQPAGPAARKTVLLVDKKRPPVVGWLVALTGEQKGEDFRVVDGQNTIGSGPDATIQLRDPTISGRHASLRYKDGKFFISDLDSSNGTFLNYGKDSIAREELKDDDILRLGEVVFKFKCL